MAKMTIAAAVNIVSNQQPRGKAGRKAYHEATQRLKAAGVDLASKVAPEQQILIWQHAGAVRKYIAVAKFAEGKDLPKDDARARKLTSALDVLRNHGITVTRAAELEEILRRMAQARKKADRLSAHRNGGNKRKQDRTKIEQPEPQAEKDPYAEDNEDNANWREAKDGELQYYESRCPGDGEIVMMYPEYAEYIDGYRDTQAGIGC